MDLLIDQQTLRDLEIFEGREGRPSLFRMLDCAKTRGGAAALRRRFIYPKGDVDSIRAVQESVRFILLNAGTFEDLPSQFAASGFDHYFHRRLTATVAGHRLALIFDMIMLRVDSPREFTQISMGVRHAMQIVGWFRKIANYTASDDPGGELGTMLAEVRAILERPAVSRLPSEGHDGWPFWKVLEIDRTIRDFERAAFARLSTLLFEIDALVSMATATSRRSFVLPEILEGPARIEGTGLFHPFLQSQVKNPICLDQDVRFLFLTGPNMAGKTTYLRTCGTVIFLAHIGMGVPAKELRFAPCEAFYTAISLADDVRSGISFFQAEALRARVIAEALAKGRRVVAIMDEPFKGTNVKDALDASCAFFSRLARRDGSLFLIASHLIEAGGMLQESGYVDCRRFEADEAASELAFNYQLRPGLSTQRLGMRVLEDHGVLRLLDS
ncbi:MAG: MutS-related protein [Gemmatimonadota bacterium]